MKIISFLVAFIVGVFIFYLYTHPAQKKRQPTDEVHLTEREAKEDSSTDIPKSAPVPNFLPGDSLNIKNVTPDRIVSFAKTLIGVPYKYASSDPSIGFDCSGFITYVFNHFNIEVPRSSKDFRNVGIEVPLVDSRRGDLILFTGTDSTEREIGHMGIVVSNDSDGLKFIHSTSGKAHGVVITTLNDYYLGRFVKVIRML